MPWSSISGPHEDSQAFLFSLTDGTEQTEGGRPPRRLCQVIYLYIICIYVYVCIHIYIDIYI